MDVCQTRIKFVKVSVTFLLNDLLRQYDENVVEIKFFNIYFLNLDDLDFSYSINLLILLLKVQKRLLCGFRLCSISSIRIDNFNRSRLSVFREGRSCGKVCL